MISANDFLIAGRPCRFVVADDVTARRNTQSASDAVSPTAMPNGPPEWRVAGRKAKAGAPRKAKKMGHRVAVICIDLERFKQVNNSYGHAVGDECLREIGATLTGRLRGIMGHVELCVAWRPC